MHRPNGPARREATQNDAAAVIAVAPSIQQPTGKVGYRPGNDAVEAIHVIARSFARVGGLDLATVKRVAARLGPNSRFDRSGGVVRDRTSDVVPIRQERLRAVGVRNRRLVLTSLDERFDHTSRQILNERYGDIGATRRHRCGRSPIQRKGIMRGELARAPAKHFLLAATLDQSVG